MYFDHVITGIEIDGKTTYVDLTTDFYPYYVLNESDMDAWGLAIKEGETQLFKLPNDYINSEKNKVIHEIACQVNSDHSIKTRCSIYASRDARRKYSRNYS